MSEMDKLDQYLKTHGYETYRHSNEIMPGEQLVAFQGTKILFDAVCNPFSQGHENDLLEIRGRKLFGDDVIGWQTAEDVIRRLEALE